MNQELQIAWQLVQKTGSNVFLTGKAGTGKTTFLRNLCSKTHKRHVVLAPTGIAAINAHGSTLHSFFQLPFGPYIPGTDPRSGERNFKFSERKRRLIRSLDLVIIDEISMVRPDLLDCVDAVLRRYRDRSRPFGGVQMLLIGDLQQLAPVTKPDEWDLLQKYYATPYFFSSLALREAGFVTIELKEVFRQTDQHFINLLNKIRHGVADAAVLGELNKRYIPGFAPHREEGYIRLTTHNWQADQVNQRDLDALSTPPTTYTAEVWKEFPELSYPTPYELTLKVGAQVMFVKNDPSPAKRYFNGMIGRVTALTPSVVKVLPQNSDTVIDVMAEEWENTRYLLNEKTHEVEEELLGTFKQIPLKTAWAITVHKSQGLTFERAIIDVQYSFSHGQTYVALSRCKTLEGLVLSTPIPPSAVISDQCVVAFTNNIAQQTPTPDALRNMERDYFLSLLAQLFTFHHLTSTFDAYIRILDEWLSRQIPYEIQRWKQVRETFESDIIKVALNFAAQYQRMVRSTDDYANDEALQERCRKGASWFAKHLEELNALVLAPPIKSGNKMVQERLTNHLAELNEQLRQKLELLNYVAANGFNAESYERRRNIASLPPKEAKKATQRKPASRNGAKSKSGEGSTPSGRPQTDKTRSGYSDAQNRAETTYNRIQREALDAFDELLEGANSYVGETIEEYTPQFPVDLPDLDTDGLPY